VEDLLDQQLSYGMGQRNLKEGQIYIESHNRRQGSLVLRLVCIPQPEKILDRFDFGYGQQLRGGQNVRPARLGVRSQRQNV